MASHETNGLTDEWYTPEWLFEAIGVVFDLDPCSPAKGRVPAHEWCRHLYTTRGLEEDWGGHVWLNPPFGKRNGIRPWLEKLVEHADGIAIVPNRTATDWWQDIASQADRLLFMRGKIRFIRPDGSEGVSPGYGNVLMAFGTKMSRALDRTEIDGLLIQ